MEIGTEQLLIYQKSGFGFISMHFDAHWPWPLAVCLIRDFHRNNSNLDLPLSALEFAPVILNANRLIPDEHEYNNNLMRVTVNEDYDVSISPTRSFPHRQTEMSY